MVAIIIYIISNAICFPLKTYLSVCQKIQKLAFPNGVKWDKGKRTLLTNSDNRFLNLLSIVSDSYKNEMKKETDKSCDLSVLVAEAGLEPTTSGL